MKTWSSVLVKLIYLINIKPVTAFLIYSSYTYPFLYCKEFPVRVFYFSRFIPLKKLRSGKNFNLVI